MKRRLGRSRLLAVALAALVVASIFGVVAAIQCPSAPGGPAQPVASAQHYGSFLGHDWIFKGSWVGRNWFGVSPVLDADNRALQAFWDARVKGSGAEEWIGRCVRIGGSGAAGPWGLYTLHPVNLMHRCEGIAREPVDRYGDYEITARALTEGDPLSGIPQPVKDDVGGYETIGNHISASPGRYSYAVRVSAAVDGGKELIDVVGPGINRNGVRLPAVILGEFETLLIHQCGASSSPGVDP